MQLDMNSMQSKYQALTSLDLIQFHLLEMGFQSNVSVSFMSWLQSAPRRRRIKSN